MTTDPIPLQVKIIGIGAGSPGHVTADAADALRSVDVFVVADKGAATDELLQVRRAILDRFVPDGGYRFVAVPDPKRGPDAGRDRDQYGAAVRDWHAARAEAYAAVLGELPEGTVVGFLVWGDPAFYDSTIRVVDAVATRMPLQVSVFAGISAIQELAAAHRIVLHEIGEPVHITTGRRLAGEWSPDLGTVVVMLDGALACRDLVERAPDLQIHWGAYLGMPQQELRSGRLADVIDELVATRARLREQHGWIMDVYALR